MKRVPFILMMTAVITAGIFLACNKKKEYAVVTPPPMSTFLGVSSGTYYIKNDPNSTFKIPVGVTTTSGSSRNVTVSVTTTTGATSAQYSVPSTTVTIPAGKVVDSLSIKGVFGGYTTTRIDTLVITITGGDVSPSDYNKTYKLVMRKYCDVVLSNFAGNFANSYDDDGGGPYGPYTVAVSNLTSTGATTGTATFTNFDLELWTPIAVNPITVNLDWTDPANFKATIPAQVIVNSYSTYGPVTITGLTGSFSSCDNTFKFTYKLTVAAGSFGSFSTVMAR